MEIKEFIANLKKSNFSLIIEDDKLLLKGNKKTIRKEEIQAIKKDEFVINYIKENKNQLIEYLSLLPQNFSFTICCLLLPNPVDSSASVNNPFSFITLSNWPR